MSEGTQGAQSESQPPTPLAKPPVDEHTPSKDFYPVTEEDLSRLGIESRLIPFVVKAASQIEQSSYNPLTLTASEAKDFVEVFDKVVSSTTTNASSRNRCFKVLRKVSQAHGILPTSYHIAGLTLTDTIPYASGGCADIWKAEKDGQQVCVKAFRTQTANNLEKIKRRFYREIIAWKYVSHPNVVPFLGVSEAVFPLCIVSPWLQNGNILDYVRKNQGANRLKLLAQAARGLEHLHSLSIVHSDVNPGNILIDKNGIARLGDFGITGVITDPTVVDPGSTTTSKPATVRYMAPELLNPTQFHLQNSNPTKESDVYSLAMTAYEVLTGILPYGSARDGIIIFHVVTGDRPTRPQANSRWLTDQIWNMITTCWEEQRELRWDMRAVHHQLSVSSTQANAEGKREAPIPPPSSNPIENSERPLPPLPVESSLPQNASSELEVGFQPIKNPGQNTRGEGLSNFVEGRGTADPEGQSDPPIRWRRSRKSPMRFQGLKVAVNIFRVFQRRRNPPATTDVRTAK